jgi:hypothetical protein
LRALNLLRSSLHYRKDAFNEGLRRAGYKVCEVSDPKPGDLLVIWNRYGGHGETAGVWERRGAKVAVIENGWLGKGWTGGEWFAVSWGHHGTGWKVGGSRWDSWNVSLKPWKVGTETVILGQRGIGEPGIASPHQWAEITKSRCGGRIRAHPGQGKATPLEDDLRGARCVLTWNSGAALSALAAGVPVFHDHPAWVGAASAKPLAAFLAGEEPLTDDDKRLSMFRNLAWGMWTLDEIRTGEPFIR